MRLTKIDSSLLNDHLYLRAEDDCSFLGEFTARQGFNFSETNKRIHNLKIPPSKAREKSFMANYKNQAIAYGEENFELRCLLLLLQMQHGSPHPAVKSPRIQISILALSRY
jgi:hypothetical protein